MQVLTVVSKLTGSVEGKESAWPGVSSLAILTTALEDATDFFTVPVTAFLPEFAESKLVKLALHGRHFDGLVFLSETYQQLPAIGPSASGTI